MDSGRVPGIDPGELRLVAAGLLFQLAQNEQPVGEIGVSRLTVSFHCLAGTQNLQNTCSEYLI